MPTFRSRKIDFSKIEPTLIDKRFLIPIKVKVWFQNRRMKWRHSKLETKSDKKRTHNIGTKECTGNTDPCDSSLNSDSCSSDDETEIDIEAE